MVLLPSWESFAMELFAMLTLALHLQTCLPSDIKSTLQNEQTVKYKSQQNISRIFMLLIRFYHKKITRTDLIELTIKLSTCT